MRLGIIGAGKIVREFLPQIKSIEGIEVVAVCGSRMKDELRELCRENDVPHAVASFEELAATGIDTVYVAVPNALHFTYCRQALMAKLNVIVEKPITSNVSEARELADLARENGCFLFEAITTMYLENYNKIKEWLPKVGTVKMIHCNYSQYSSRYDAFRSGTVLPVFDPAKSGGALMDLNIYNLYFVMGLFGSPASAEYIANIERGIDTSGTVVMRYDGFLATCSAAKDCAAPLSFVIEGTDGYISTQYAPNLIGEVTLHLNDGTEEVYDDGMSARRAVPEFSYFLDCISNDRLDECMERLELSVAVSEVQTAARLGAGVVFAADA